MAIQLDLANSQFGVPFNGAYFRIVTAALTRQRGGVHSVMLDVVGYATAPENDDTQGVDFRRYHTPLNEIESMDGENTLAKCYTWLMAQEDMNGSLAV